MSSKTYRVQGMDCANCAREVENGVARLEGVDFVTVDFASTLMRLEGDVPFDVLQARVRALGKSLVAPDAVPADTTRRGGLAGFIEYLLLRQETRLALVGGALVIISLLLGLLGLPEALVNGVTIAGMGVTLLPILKSGVNGLRINREFNINLLMSIAAFGAVFIGEYLEAATVIFLFAIGEALEGYTADRARASIRSLMSIAPPVAIRLRRAAISAPGDNFIPLLINAPETVNVADLLVDDVLLVKPGERIPMDGVVLAGMSAVDQAPITGESLPVAKAPGAEVFAGTINGDGALEIRVTRLAADNTLSRIIQLVEQAQSVRAPSQRVIDRFAHYYTPGVVIAALLTATVPPLLFNAPFHNLADGTQGWLYRALELLVIACPCSLVISTPVTIISAITAAARRGILVKGGAYLEALAGIRAVAFDKTGTLTEGKPVVLQTRSVECFSADGCDRCDEVLALAAAVEQGSAHPLAKAVQQAAEQRGLMQRYAPAQGVVALAGQGVRGQVNGQAVSVGSHQWFDAELPHSAEVCGWVAQAEAQGQTTMLLAQGEAVRGFIALADKPRSQSAAVIRALRDEGIHTIMLTGDNPAAAQAVAASIGLDTVRAGLLPADKVTAVNHLRDEHGSVAMVGDGINDTPALAAATVGIAMGGAGSAQALETADVVLMSDDLSQLPFAIRLARFARHLIRQNIVVSITLKLAVILLALAGGATLWLAVLADVGMSLLVTLNGMRPLRWSQSKPRQ